MTVSNHVSDNDRDRSLVSNSRVMFTCPLISQDKWMHKYAFFSSSKTFERFFFEEPKMCDCVLKAWLGFPFLSTSIRLQRFVTAYFHKQWFRLKCPGQTGRRCWASLRVEVWCGEKYRPKKTVRQPYFLIHWRISSGKWEQLSPNTALNLSREKKPMVSKYRQVSLL